jgi:hypothetical protein
LVDALLLNKLLRRDAEIRALKERLDNSLKSYPIS